MSKNEQSDWHAQSIEKVIMELGSSLDGLSEEEVKKRIVQFGPNKIPEEKPLRGLKLFLSQFANPLIYILLIASLISLILKEYSNAIIIAIIVLLNTIIGYLQENKTSQALSALKKILKLYTVVLRNGKKQKILQEEVVPGDILILSAGNKIPADARLINVKELEVNEATLTGESESAKKYVKQIKTSTSLANRNNMVYMGSSVDNGYAQAIVCATGLNTEFGQIAKVIKHTEEEKTPFQKKLVQFSKVIGIIIAIITALIFIGGMIGGGKFIEIFTTSIAVVVAAIPEGLPIAITVIFAIGMQRILKRKGLVRRLVSAETLGTTSVICADKTSTLTEGKMSLVNITTADNKFVTKDFNKIKKDKTGCYIDALKIAVLRSDTFTEDKIRNIIHGRPTDQALAIAGNEAGLDKKDLVKKEPVIDEILFSADNKFSASLHKYSKEKNIIYVMGAPELLLEMSSEIEHNKKQEALTKEKIAKINKKHQELTLKGLRVLAVAYNTTQNKKIDKNNLKNLIFVGLISLQDPLRNTVKTAIKTCQNAGIKPILITGDHLLTARAIATEIGLPCKDINIIQGHELEKLSNNDLAKRIDKIQVYARTEPVQKLRIVKIFQKKGEIVAMTGDGINDAPALKQANIGIAVGSGTQVAQEVSDLVLLSDNFSVIVAAVEEGRAIIDNIRKVITYLLSGNFTEIILIGGALTFGMPLPVLAGQILWINLITDSLPAIALGFEPKEHDLMKQKPESKDIPILTNKMKMLIFTIGIVVDLFLLGLFWWLIKNTNYSLAHIRTFIFVGLLIDSLFFIFACKSLRKNIWQINIFSNIYLIAAWIYAIIMLLLALYIPILQNLLKTEPLNTFDIILLLGFGIFKLFLIELVKWWYIKKNNKAQMINIK